MQPAIEEGDWERAAAILAEMRLHTRAPSALVASDVESCEHHGMLAAPLRDFFNAISLRQPDFLALVDAFPAESTCAYVLRVLLPRALAADTRKGRLPISLTQVAGSEIGGVLRGGGDQAFDTLENVPSEDELLLRGGGDQALDAGSTRAIGTQADAGGWRPAIAS